MPYEVTATRKRPQSFEQLAGQEFVAATLEKSLETGRIAHAYLFSGPRGCGKTSTARILAKALNCEKGPTPEPCGTCDSCRSIQAGSAFDVIEIDGASNTSVENVRQIKDEVLFPPNSSRYKIYIIDEVHMLSTSAFNALLKTIEEPPPYVIFMFATTEQHKVPATIKSRCQQFTFRLVASDLMVELLAAAAADLGVSAEPEALLWIARESGGSVRDAYTLFDQVLSFAEGNITAALIREKLGLVGQDRMNALFGQFVAGDTAGALSSLDAILSGGVSPEQFVADMVEYCRAILLVKNGITRESILGATLSSFDLGITEALSGERIERILSIFLGAYRYLKESIDPRYELDLAVAKASHINSWVPPSDLVRAVGALKRHLENSASGLAGAQPPARPAAQAFAQPSARPPVSSAPPLPKAAVAPARETATPAAATPAQASAAPAAHLLDPSRLPELKKALVADIRKSNVLLATTLDKSHSWRLDEDVLAISVQTPMECDLLKRFLGIVAELLALRLGSPRKVEVALARENLAGSDLDDEMQTKGGLGPGESPFEAPGAGAGLAQASRLPPAFNERQRADAPDKGAPAGREAPSREAPSRAAPSRAAPVGEPVVSPYEREAIGLVERLFKGSLVGYSQPAVSRAAGQADTGAAATKTPVIEDPGPSVDDDDEVQE